jgi:leucyl/phenylalanyl-tRNA--protein transferase
MPIYQLSDDIAFPPADHAEEDGLLAVGGDLDPARLLLAYGSGIFPWPHRGYPLLWFSPDPRMVLFPAELKVARSLRQVLSKNRFEIRYDTAFPEVMRQCGKVPRKGQKGTWITKPMLEAYTRLHELGHAHSAESWRDGRLVGGLYGVTLGRAFFGESMFALEDDASKVAFVTLVRRLHEAGCTLIDAQVHTAHLARFGARQIPRAEYMQHLHTALEDGANTNIWPA